MGPRGSEGFTLIEVIGALLIFSVGVLMVVRLSSSLSRQISRAGLSSEIVMIAQQRLDSLGALPYDSLSVGSAEEELTIQSVPYVCTVEINQYHPLLRQIDVSLVPEDGEGPSYTATSYRMDAW